MYWTCVCSDYYQYHEDPDCSYAINGGIYELLYTHPSRSAFYGNSALSYSGPYSIYYQKHRAVWKLLYMDKETLHRQYRPAVVMLVCNYTLQINSRIDEISYKTYLYCMLSKSSVYCHVDRQTVYCICPEHDLFGRIVLVQYMYSIYNLNCMWNSSEHWELSFEKT